MPPMVPRSPLLETAKRESMYLSLETAVVNRTAPGRFSLKWLLRIVLALVTIIVLGLTVWTAAAVISTRLWEPCGLSQRCCTSL